jgi:hypothetical protein
MVAAAPPKPIFRKDYKPLPYVVEQVSRRGERGGEKEKEFT